MKRCIFRIVLLWASLEIRGNGFSFHFFYRIAREGFRTRLASGRDSRPSPTRLCEEKFTAYPQKF
jgi:hypothetical protein